MSCPSFWFFLWHIQKVRVTHFDSSDSKLIFSEINRRFIPFSLNLRRFTVETYLFVVSLTPLGENQAWWTESRNIKLQQRCNISDHLAWLRRRCSFTLPNEYQSKLAWNTFFSSRQMKGTLLVRPDLVSLLTYKDQWFFLCRAFMMLEKIVSYLK